MWGEVNKESILKAYTAFLDRAKDKDKELRNFAKLSIELSGKIDCPYWIDELNAIADTVKIDRELYIAFTFGRYRDLALLYKGVGCTSFAVTPPATKNGQIIFHKTRETAPDLQAGYLKKITDATPAGKKPYSLRRDGTADTGVCSSSTRRGRGARTFRAWQPTNGT
jgi:hypothetical protein